MENEKKENLQDFIKNPEKTGTVVEQSVPGTGPATVDVSYLKETLTEVGQNLQPSDKLLMAYIKDGEKRSFCGMHASKKRKEAGHE